MEIEIKNFGPIDYLKFDIDKDIHLIYGKNAVGKSYATYLIYSLVKNLKEKKVIGLRSAELFNQYLENLLSDKVEVTDFIQKLAGEAFNKRIIEDIENSLLNTFNSLTNLNNKYSNQKFEINLYFNNSDTIKIFLNSKDKLDLKYVSSNKIKISLDKDNNYSLEENENVIFTTKDIEKFDTELFLYSERISKRILRDFKTNIREVYYLPASRSGLYQALNSLAPLIAELSQNRQYLKNKTMQIPEFSEPISEYFLDITSVNKANTNPEYEEIISLLENQVLKGEIDFDDFTKKILYKPVGIDLELNISQASSMVAELSPLVLFFKHIINHKNYHPFSKKENEYDIIFIEEPEAHLHPEVQVKLMEIFAKLPALNIKIFITSHSNYMFNKVNNLLIKKEIDPEIIAVYHLIKSENGSTINSNMFVSEEGINDENFHEITEQLYMERLNSFEND